MEEGMALYGYVFIEADQDSERQEREQCDIITAYARQRLGGEIDAFIVEKDCSIKGALKERPGGKKLLGQLRPGDAVISSELKFFLGSASEAAKLVARARREGVALHCVDLAGNISLDEKTRLAVTQGSAGLIAKVLGALAVCESSRHGDAIRAAKKSRREQGKYLGGPVPFGWRVNGQGYLVEDAGQQKIIRKIRKLRAQRWSYREISRALREEYNVQLSHEGVRRILLTSERRKAGEREKTQKE